MGIRRTTVNRTEATDRQVAFLQAQGFGTFTDIVRIAIDRMHKEERRAMKAQHTFAREEIEAAAAAALDNWDFDVEPEYAEQMRQSLQDIVDGSDDIGSDADYPATWKGSADRATAIVDWLDEYTRTH